MDTVELSFKLNVGHPGVDDDPLNPLSRAFQGLMKEGRPHQGHALCFYSGEERDLRNVSSPRWLGIFALSAWGRIIFFPGFPQAHTWIKTTTSRITSPRIFFNQDHISLEPLRQSWHFTTANSTDHKSGGRARDLGQGRLSWFGLSVASENILRQVYSTTVAIFPSPPSDLHRRITHLSDKQKAAPHHLLRLMNGSKDRFKKGFLHFYFTAIPKKESNYEGPVWLIPNGSPSLSKPFPKSIPNFQKAIYRIPLFGLYDIQISCMWLPGELSVPSVWTTCSSL
ncbi:MAG: hypothetical protein KAV97_04515 [Actinomycetia bacterium]|nr:hypothetical protein [Actinomycetes bacterium]